jgi:hypothetical protein
MANRQFGSGSSDSQRPRRAIISLHADRCRLSLAKIKLSCVGWIWKIWKKPWYELAQPVQRFHVDKTQDSKRRRFSPHEKVAVVKRHLLERVPISNQPSLERLGYNR